MLLFGLLALLLPFGLLALLLPFGLLALLLLFGLLALLLSLFFFRKSNLLSLSDKHYDPHKQFSVDLASNFFIEVYLCQCLAARLSNLGRDQYIFRSLMYLVHRFVQLLAFCMLSLLLGHLHLPVMHLRTSILVIEPLGA